MKTSMDARKTWWWFREAQTRLIKWTLALLRGRRYSIRIEDEGTGYHDPENHVIQANPSLFPKETPETQFRATQGILAHEVGHAWFTGEWPDQEGGRLQEMTNYLEDQRIENAVGILYPGVAPAIRLLGDLMLAEQKALSRMNPAEQAYACCLIWRWSWDRIGEREMLDLLRISPGGERLWIRVKPLVEQAWGAADTGRVIELAREILEILGIDPRSRPMKLNWTSTKDIPRARPDRPLPFPGKPDDAVQPGLGTGELDEEKGSLFSDAYSLPAPYVDLEDQARPLARQLSEALQLPTPDVRPEPHESQGRYHFRQEIRTPDTPHLLVQSIDCSPRDLALYLLVDRSGSMATIEEEVRLALMMLYLAGTELEIPTGVAFFGARETDRVERVMEVTAPTPASSESVKALIAGFEGTTNCEFLDWGLTLAERAFTVRPERLKVLLVLHDGDPVYKGPDGNDWQLSFSHVRKLERSGIMTIGIYLGDEDESRRKVQQLFPKLISCKGKELPDKLGNVLRSLA
jgi:hypothetical protein